MNSIKHKIFNIINDTENPTKASKFFNISIITLILVNILLIILDTFNMPYHIVKMFNLVEFISTIIFTAEYVLRVWTSDLLYPALAPFKARLRYIKSFMALIDLLSILPFYIPFIIPIDLRALRTLRIFRLLRLFKINRYTKALSSIYNVFKNKFAQLMSSMAVVLILIIISSILMYNIESAAQPGAFSNALDGMWWAVATLTTVGYGDIYPTTTLGKLLSSVIALLGIGIVAIPTGIISAGFVESIEDTKTTDDKKCFCPYCGHKLDN